MAAPQEDFDVTVPFRMATANVPASGPFKVTATASATTRTFSHPGKGTVTAGEQSLVVDGAAWRRQGGLALGLDQGAKYPDFLLSGSGFVTRGKKAKL